MIANDNNEEEDVVTINERRYKFQREKDNHLEVVIGSKKRMLVHSLVGWGGVVGKQRGL